MIGAFKFVMAGLVPAIHVFSRFQNKTWMPGSSPGMTAERIVVVVSMDLGPWY
jgi:hypothetical protein